MSKNKQFKDFNQIADELKVDRQRIYRFFSKQSEEFKESITRNGFNNKFLFTLESAEILKQKFIEYAAINQTFEEEIAEQAGDLVNKQNEQIISQQKQIEELQQTLQQLNEKYMNSFENITNLINQQINLANQSNRHFEMLEEQLKVKDEQIQNTQKLLENSQVLQGQMNMKVQQLESHILTIEQKHEEEKSKNFFQKLFKGKS